MAGSKQINLLANALDIAIYADIESLRQQSKGKLNEVISFLIKTKYTDITHSGMEARHKRGRKLVSNLPIKDVDYVKPYSKSDIDNISLLDIKKSRFIRSGFVSNNVSPAQSKQ